jgi:hypothetical protein
MLQQQLFQGLWKLQQQYSKGSSNRSIESSQHSCTEKDEPAQLHPPVNTITCESALPLVIHQPSKPIQLS